MSGASDSHSGAKAPAAEPWWDRAVFYHLLVDRFRRGGSDHPSGNPRRPEFCGGDLWGIIERLDYLRELGINTLLLSPIHPTTAYHGYHTIDYDGVEARFGGMAAFKALIQAARPDFRIVMDWVPNHVHHTHPFFLEALSSPHSEYRDWFFFDRHGRWRCFLDFTELPKLNLDHPPARRYMIDTALRWLDRGADGFRLDHVLGPSMSFWREFQHAVKQHKPTTYLLGEAWFAGMKRKCLNTLGLPHKLRHFADSQRGLDVTSAVMQEYAGVLDGVLDFEFQRILKQHLAHAKGRPSVRRIQSMLDRHQAKFPAGFSLPSFLDNHDMNRFLFEAHGRQARLKLAAEIQLRQSQPPIVYYGTEVGLSQTLPMHGPHGDLQARGFMPWDRMGPDLLKCYRHLIRNRGCILPAPR